MTSPIKFSLPDGYNPQQLSGAFADPYVIIKERSLRRKTTIYDTFDWRLFNKSLVLHLSEKTLFLRKLFKNDIVYSAEITSPPVFIRDFPAGDLKERLSSILKQRALLKLIELHSRWTPYRILNQDKKTVAHLALEEIRPAQGKTVPILASYLWLQPVRGYTKICRDIVKHLEEAGFSVPKKEDIYFNAMTAAGKSPGDYSSKLTIELEPAMRSDAATKIILRYLLQIMKINEAHLEKNLDTEFLHDFRVAIRRTRSALGQIKSVFPKNMTDQFKKDFSFMGKLSNRLRDIDVYLLKEDAYRSMLPDVLRNEIDPLFSDLKKKRSKALRDVIRGLKSDRYRKIMKDWEVFLDQPLQDLPPASDADLPIITLAKKKIFKQYLRIVKDGRHILENIDDRKLHILRIECKKLRYMLEFFSSLFPRKKIKMLISQLRRLQDDLGNFNDLYVQEISLLKIAEEIPATERKHNKTLVAIGSLIGILNNEKQLLIDPISKKFAKYASPPNQKAFRKLFASEPKEKAP